MSSVSLEHAYLASDSIGDDDWQDHVSGRCGAQSLAAISVGLWAACSKTVDFIFASRSCTPQEGALGTVTASDVFKAATGSGCTCADCMGFATQVCESSARHHAATFCVQSHQVLQIY